MHGLYHRLYHSRDKHCSIRFTPPIWSMTSLSYIMQRECKSDQVLVPCDSPMVRHFAKGEDPFGEVAPAQMRISLVIIHW